MALFPRVYCSCLGRDIINETHGTNTLRVRYASVESCAISGRGEISSTPCNKKVNVVVRTRPIFSYCGSVYGGTNTGIRLVCLAPRKGALARRHIGRLTGCSGLTLLYNRCRNVSRHIVRRLRPRRVSIKSCILANNRLPTLVITSSITEVVPNILSGRRYFASRDRFSSLLRCPRCAHPIR